MSWKGKFVFLLIVYFAGFATAVYNFAPSGEKGSNASAYVSKGSDYDYAAAFAKLRDKAAAKLREVDTQKVKNAFNSSMHKLLEMAKNSQLAAANGQNKTSEGSESK
jgi:hypothetical protein